MKRAIALLLCAHAAHATIPFLDSSYTIQALKIVDQMSVQEKIAQLFMVSAVSNTDLNYDYLQTHPHAAPECVEELIKKYHIGGIIFQGSGRSAEQKELTQKFQHMSKLPLLIGQDLEWGLSMRMIDGMRFPRAMTLGAVTDNTIIHEVAFEIGKQAADLGVDIVFAPVVDVNTNPLNPVIHDRAFSSDPALVAGKAAAFMHGLAQAGVLSCIKHFPGHGDTLIDSHVGLPHIAHEKERLDRVELYPFKKLIGLNAPAVMIAHMHVPALATDGKVCSVSAAIIHDVIKKELGFQGLVITDGLDMHALDQIYEPGERELAALLAGNDIILCPSDVISAFKMIEEAISLGSISVADVDAHVVKLLQAKLWIADGKTSISPSCDSSYAHEIQKNAFVKAITVVQDSGLLPLGPTDEIFIIQTAGTQCFREEMLASQLKITTLDLDGFHDRAIKSTARYIIPITHMNKQIAHNYGITNEIFDTLAYLKERTAQIIVVIFGTPYSIPLIGTQPTILLAFEDTQISQKAAAQIMCGKLTAQGKLAVSFNLTDSIQYQRNQAQQPCLVPNDILLGNNQRD